jgi:hypothetical protein
VSLQTEGATKAVELIAGVLEQLAQLELRQYYMTISASHQPSCQNQE